MGSFPAWEFQDLENKFEVSCFLFPPQLCSLLLRGDRREEEGLGPNARCLGPGELKSLLTASRHPGDEHVLPEPDTSLLHTRST